MAGYLEARRVGLGLRAFLRGSETVSADVARALEMTLLRRQVAPRESRPTLENVRLAHEALLRIAAPHDAGRHRDLGSLQVVLIAEMERRGPRNLGRHARLEREFHLGQTEVLGFSEPLDQRRRALGEIERAWRRTRQRYQVATAFLQRLLTEAEPPTLAVRGLDPAETVWALRLTTSIPVARDLARRLRDFLNKYDGAHQRYRRGVRTDLRRRTALLPAGIERVLPTEREWSRILGRRPIELLRNLLQVRDLSRGLHLSATYQGEQPARWLLGSGSVVDVPGHGTVEVGPLGVVEFLGLKKRAVEALIADRVLAKLASLGIVEGAARVGAPSATPAVAAPAVALALPPGRGWRPIPEGLNYISRLNIHAQRHQIRRPAIVVTGGPDTFQGTVRIRKVGSADWIEFGPVEVAAENPKRARHLLAEKFYRHLVELGEIVE